MAKYAELHQLPIVFLLLVIKTLFFIQFVQKRDPERYKEEKDNTVWSMEKLNEYINEKVAPEKGLDKDWCFNILTVSIIAHIK